MSSLILTECLCVLLAALIATIAITPLAKKIALHAGAMDYPGVRRINTRPTPRMGGIALAGGMVVSGLVIEAGVYFLGWVDPFRSYIGLEINYAFVFAGMGAIFLTGVIDDIRGMRPLTKFVLQTISAMIVSASGLLLETIQNPFIPEGYIHFGWLSYPITVFYLVAFANIINLIDGLDGLASGISAISAASIMVFSFLYFRFDSTILSCIIIGICIGFLVFNHHPASIFMGDSGSLLLGFALGIISLTSVARSTLFISLLVPILSTAIPITDTAAAIIRRIREHRHIDEPDTGHIHHRLIDAGFSQNNIVLLLCSLTLVLAVCAIMIALFDGVTRYVAIIVSILIVVVLITRLHLVEPAIRHIYSHRRQDLTDEQEKDEGSQKD